MTRQEIIDEARRWLGVPFLWQGSTVAGVDCVGLVCGVARRVGAAEAVRGVLHDHPRRPPSPDHLLRQMDAAFLRQVRRPLPGDVLAFRVGSAVRHLGILVGPDMVVASCSRAGRVVEHGLTEWRPRLAAVYALPGLED